MTRPAPKPAGSEVGADALGWQRYVPGETTTDFGMPYVVVGRSGAKLVLGQRVAEHRPVWIFALPEIPRDAAHG